MIRRLYLPPLVALVMLIAVSVPAQARTITDLAGVRVKVPAVIRKVYGTAPPVTYMVYAVAPDMLVGLNMPLPRAGRQFLTPRMRKLPVMGGWFGQGRGANLEVLMRSRPDVVLAFRWRGGPSVTWKIEETLKPLGLPVVNVVIRGIRDYPRALRFLGRLLGRPRRAEALARYAEKTLAAMARLRRRLPPARRVKVYYAQGGRGLLTECHTSFHAELIPLAGGVNVHRCQIKAICGLDKISLEQVLAYNPQVILTWSPMFYRAVRQDPRWRRVRAVSQGRVYQIPTQPFNWFDRPPSFMSLLGAHWTAHTLYPKYYRVDMAAKVIEFYKLFLGVKVDRATAVKLLGR